MKKIIVLFKTHLDVGFIGLAADIVKKYNDEYIPKAIKVARELSKDKEGFTWTTGSWLVWQYLRNASSERKAEMEEAIRNKWISWHGLPATFHSEAMGIELYNYAINIAKELDRKYERKSIAAKYTDVPGHTIGIVPPLSKHGIELLHIGVNPASMPPEVPNIFRWKAPTGEEIKVIYNKGSYGDFFEIPGTDCAACFAHTNDNMGPQSTDEIRAVYANLKEKYCEAEIVSGDLNDLALLLRDIREELPVITSEIGDTWIHGVGSDPQKMSLFRRLQKEALLWDEEDRNTLFDSLLLIPEHTWGLDEKTFLNDHNNYSLESFDKVKNTAPYKLMEKSWQEQRYYLTANKDKLSDKAKTKLNKIINSYIPLMPDNKEFSSKEIASEYKLNGFVIAVNKSGAITKIKYNDKTVTGEMFGFEYEVFSEKEVLAYGDRYMSNKFNWAIEDFGKVGLSQYIHEYKHYKPELMGVYEDKNTLILKLSVSNLVTEEYGCPQNIYLCLKTEEDMLKVQFVWKNKNALRIPEALWLKFDSSSEIVKATKLNSEISFKDVISNGNREMHCIDGEVTFKNCKINSFDTGLISIGEKNMYSFKNKIPATDKGIYFNLFNNQWGTNFTMWYNDDASFEFELKLT